MSDALLRPRLVARQRLDALFEQAALHGVLTCIRDLGLTLLALA
jgi:hypothetical protein